eukprot:1900998-Rhodomonas_salina.1
MQSPGPSPACTGNNPPGRSALCPAKSSASPSIHSHGDNPSGGMLPHTASSTHPLRPPSATALATSSAVSPLSSSAGTTTPSPAPQNPGDVICTLHSADPHTIPRS